MLELDFEALSAVGLTPALAARAAALPLDAAVEGDAPQLVRVTEVHRETVNVHDGRDERSARPLGRLLRSLGDEGTTLAVGDWAIARAEGGQSWLTQRVPPLSHVARRDGEGRRHAIVSNVDIALLVMGLDDDYNPRRLERFLALVRDDAIVPVVVLTKRDIVAAQTLDGHLSGLRARVPAGIDIHAVNATDASAALALRDYCTRGTTLVLLGSSGAGKSTLTNTLLGTSVQPTRAVRERDGRGRHTTTSRSLHRLPGGACIVDTPGLRTLQPDGDAAAVAASFGDIEALAARCRFGDCAHESEPGCAVRAAVDADRLQNYRKLVREAGRATLTPLDRQQQLARWKARSRATREWMKWKRGAGTP